MEWSLWPASSIERRSFRASEHLPSVFCQQPRRPTADAGWPSLSSDSFPCVAFAGLKNQPSPRSVRVVFPRSAVDYIIILLLALAGWLLAGCSYIMIHMLQMLSFAPYFRSHIGEVRQRYTSPFVRHSVLPPPPQGWAENVIKPIS